MTLTPGWDALAYAVQQRRARLGMTQEDVSSKGGPSTVTVRNIESAASTNFRARTLFQLDEALAWGKGTSQEILEGPDYFGTFEEFVNNVIKDTRAAERRGDDFPVGWQTEARVGDVRADIVASGPDGEITVIEVKRQRRLSDVSDEELVAELAARLRRRGHAQESEPQQGTRGQASGSSGGRGAPIEPPPESMDKLRKLNGEDTNRSRDDPKSG